MQVGIVGYGVVGQHLHQMLGSLPGQIVIYDRHKDMYCGAARRCAINSCDLVFIAVPTPPTSTGHCDTSHVEEVVRWVTAPMCIKSTIPPGTTDRLKALTQKRIVFSPEYCGETPFHQYQSSRIPDLVVVGGDCADSEPFINLFRLVLGPLPIYFQTDAVTAELAKYMENCFFATKVAFVAQFAILAKHFGAHFTELREIWVADSRVGRSHSTVVGDLGFGGRCLPKDISAIVCAAEDSGLKPDLLAAVQEFNRTVRAACNSAPEANHLAVTTGA